MTVEQFRKHMADGLPVELRKLLAELWGHEVPESIGMFPLFIKNV